MKSRTKFIIGLSISVAIIVIGVLIITLSNATLSQLEKATQATIWVVVISLLGIIIYAIYEVYWQVTKSKPLVEVIEDQNVLKRRYEEIRRTEGAESIQAIWSATYLDVDSYFRTEASDLERNPALEIERLVNPAVIAGKDRNIFAAFVKQHTNLTVYATDVNEFECFLCEYKKKSDRHLKALLVLNDTLSRTPQLGIYIESEKSSQLKPIAYALQSWFLRLPRNQFPGLDEIVNIWEVNAPAYDGKVTETTLLHLRTFIEEEERLLEDTLEQMTADSRLVSIIEVGTGTARSLFNLLKKPELVGKIAYLIGIDNATNMIRIARSKRESLIIHEKLSGKFFFFQIPAQQLADYFFQGHIMLERLRTDKINGEVTSKLSETTYGATSKLFCCLLNTLGVMDADTRTRTIRGMVAAASKSDKLVFSVFSGDSFATRAHELYRSIAELVGGYSEASFDHDKSEFRAPNYFSHWFGLDQFRHELESEGCAVDDVKSVDGWGHFIICSVNRDT